MSDAVGRVEFTMGGEHHHATLTTEGHWLCTDPGVASILNEAYCEPGDAQRGRDWGVYVLYRVATRLGGRVRVEGRADRPIGPDARRRAAIGAGSVRGAAGYEGMPTAGHAALAGVSS